MRAALDPPPSVRLAWSDPPLGDHGRPQRRASPEGYVEIHGACMTGALVWAQLLGPAGVIHSPRGAHERSKMDSEPSATCLRFRNKMGPTQGVDAYSLPKSDLQSPLLPCVVTTCTEYHFIIPSSIRRISLQLRQVRPGGLEGCKLGSLFLTEEGFPYRGGVRLLGRVFI